MSSDKNRRGPRPRTAALAASAVAVGTVLLTVACGGSSSSGPAGSSSSPGSSTIAKDVAYADCMSAHGLDITVNSNGDFSASNSSGSSDTPPQNVQGAQNACQHLLPSGSQPSQARQLSHLEQLLKYAQCMRSHGVPNFPDPISEGNGAYSFGAPQVAPSNGAGGGGINPNSAAYQKASQACQSIMPGLRQP
jgi:hypothetical protein